MTIKDYHEHEIPKVPFKPLNLMKNALTNHAVCLKDLKLMLPKYRFQIQYSSHTQYNAYIASQILLVHQCAMHA